MPVKDLQKSMQFFGGLGFQFNPAFTNEKAACMVVSEHIFVMLLTEPFFQTFTKKSISDAHAATEVLIGLDASSKAEVQEMVEKAVSLGGKTYAEPQDHGWMFQHSFADLDGHQWEIIYMDEAQFVAQNG